MGELLTLPLGRGQECRAWTNKTSRLAPLAGVSTRALHHYDRLGLLRPSRRTSAGYRHYSTADLPRRHRIAVYRELGADMDEPAGILADPARSDEDHLRRQHGLATDRVSHFQTTLELIDKELEALAAGTSSRLASAARWSATPTSPTAGREPDRLGGSRTG